jgi:hypothetical protein
MSTAFQPGDRFSVAPLGDRYDGVTGKVRRVYTAFDGVMHADVTHDDGTVTTWPVSRLVAVEPTSATGLADLTRRVTPVAGPDVTGYPREVPTGAVTHLAAAADIVSDRGLTDEQLVEATERMAAYLVAVIAEVR